MSAQPLHRAAAGTDMAGRPNIRPKTPEQLAAEKAAKVQKSAVDISKRSSGGGKAGAVAEESFDSQARKRPSLSIGGGTGMTPISGSQGGRIGANIP